MQEARLSVEAKSPCRWMDGCATGMNCVCVYIGITWWVGESWSSSQSAIVVFNARQQDDELIDDPIDLSTMCVYYELYHERVYFSCVSTINLVLVL